MSKNSFTEGKILSPLLHFALPVLAALLLQAMYGGVDLLVVGQFGIAADVSAVSTGSQMMQTVTMIITGLAMAITIMVGQLIGKGSPEKAGETIGSGIYLFAILGVLVTIGMYFIAPIFADWMKVPPEALDKTISYLRICGFGSLFIIAYNVLGSIFRGIGDSRTPLFTVFIACIVNIVGDLIFVGVFNMAASGAALATVLAQGVSVLLSLVMIRKRGFPFPFQRSFIRFKKEIIKEILRLGCPISLQSCLVSISFLVITAIVNALGVVPSAGVGVAEKLCSFIMLVPSAFMQSISAFVAQNIGAGQNNRAIKAMGYGMLCSFGFSVVVGYLSFFHGEILAALFAKDTAVILAAAEYLKAYAIDTLLVSFMFCFVGYFNGCGRTTFVMWQGFIGAFGIRIPFSYLMSQATTVSLFHIGLATPISTVVQILLCLGYFLLMNRKTTNYVHRV